MEYGFVGLCNKDDKVLSGLLKESNNIDYLGLRKMNVRLSNLMFPFGNTLMPNLVYFYYLHAIYYAVLYGEESPKEERKPTEEEIQKINELEKLISKSIIEKGKNEKGFFGDVKSRAYGIYKNSMQLMHFFDPKWIPTFKGDQTTNWKNNKKSLYEYLKATERYEFVLDIYKSTDEKRKNKIEEYKDKEWLCKLENREKIDFIWRVIDPYGPEKGTITSFSLFSNIVMYYCGITNKPSKYNDRVYNEKYSIPKPNQRKIKKFEELGEIFNEQSIAYGTERNTYSKVNQSPVYEVALEYTRLQQIAKITYKMCLFDKNVNEKEKYKKQLKEFIEQYKHIYKETKINSSSKKDEYRRVFFNVADESLIDAFKFVKNISEIILDKNVNIDDRIDRIVELVKEQEYKTLGGNSRLDSGMVFENMGNYKDTFRWEYRPEIEINASGNNNECVQEECNKVNSEQIQNKCAQYYIYELFFEE